MGYYVPNRPAFTLWIRNPMRVAITAPAAEAIVAAARSLAGAGEYGAGFKVSEPREVGHNIERGWRTGSIVYNDVAYALVLEVGSSVPGPRPQGGRITAKHTLRNAAKAILGHNDRIKGGA